MHEAWSLSLCLSSCCLPEMGCHCPLPCFFLGSQVLLGLPTLSPPRDCCHCLSLERALARYWKDRVGDTLHSCATLAAAWPTNLLSTTIQGLSVYCGTEAQRSLGASRLSCIGSRLWIEKMTGSTSPTPPLTRACCGNSTLIEGKTVGLGLHLPSKHPFARKLGRQEREGESSLFLLL